MRYFPALALLLCPLRTPAQDHQLAALIPELMARANVPGLSIALIEEGKIAWVGSFGVKNSKSGEKVDGRTVFQAASLSKVVFAYGVLKLVDQGQLDLDAPLSQYVPEYVQNDYRINAIKARHVLTHRTGFPNWRPEGQPLVIHFKPGDRFSYSGEGFVYLQRAVEKITGLPLDTWMRQTVFDPLKMTDSSYLWQPKYDALAASGHSSAGTPDKFFKPSADGSPINGGGGPAAASTLLTTARDYATFLIAIMNGTGLKKETSRAMLTPQSQVDAGCFNCIGRPITQVSDSIAWGLGVGIEQTAHGPFFWHWGDNGDFKAFFAASAGSRNGVVIFTNSSNGMMIIPDIAARALGETQPAFDWIHYERYDSPRMQLQQAILDKGLDEALQNYQPLEEDSLNSLGYQLLVRKKFKEALRIFELNAAAHSKSANAWDSLAEAYMIAGKELAIQYYRKSLEIDPGNSNASDMLKKLDAK
jgi:CubicO group peptidase (beta-lactamase class C family)